jgi:hypothetical protein
MYNDGIIISWRAGTANDPYVNKSDVKKVVNNVIPLDEIPSEFSHVTISGYFEIYGGTPNSNQYIVNYQNGVVTFNPSENGKTLTCTYQGKGQIFYPAERIYLHSDNPDIVTSLQEIVEESKSTLDAITSQGSSFPVFKGTYSNTTAYVKNNIVTYNGSSYINIADCIGIVPTNTSKWSTLASKGSDGVNGTNGTNGADGNTADTTNVELLYWMGGI